MEYDYRYKNIGVQEPLYNKLKKFWHENDPDRNIKSWNAFITELLLIAEEKAELEKNKEEIPKESAYYK